MLDDGCSLCEARGCHACKSEPEDYAGPAFGWLCVTHCDECLAADACYVEIARAVAPSALPPFEELMPWWILREPVDGELALFG